MEDTYKQQEEVSALLLTLDYETMLQVTLQSKLETNIRILADAISKNAAATNTLKQKVSCLEAQGNDNLRRLDGVDKIIDRKIKESVDQNIKELVDQKIDESLRRNESMRRNNAKK